MKRALKKRDFRRSRKTKPTSARTAHILTQDDEETIREIVCSMLTSSHYDCRAVASPTEALEILRSGKEVDLVLCGVIESLEDKLIESVAERFPDVPVVATGGQPVALFLQALHKGAYDFLPKPFGREQLLVVIDRALEYRRLKLENRAYARLLT